MAQVIRKFATGGQTETKPPRLFEWAGQQYDVDALKNNVIRERENWLKRNNYSNRERELFDQGFNQLIKAMDAEGFTRNPDGSWTNTTGVSSTGKRDTNILGMTKRTDNNAVGLAAQLLNYTMGITPVYKNPTSQSTTPTKQRFNMNLKDYVTKKYLGGNWNYDTYQKYDDPNSTGKFGQNVRIGHALEAVNNYLEQLNSPDFDSKYDLPENFTNKAELVQYLSDAKSKLADGTLNNADYTSLARAGLSGLDELLGIANQEQQVTLTPEQQAAQTQANQVKAKEDWIKKIVEDAKNNYWRVNVNKNPLESKVIPGYKMPDKTIAEINGSSGKITTIPGMTIPASYKPVEDNFTMSSNLEKPTDVEAFSRLLQGLNFEEMEKNGMVDEQGNYYISQLKNEDTGTIVRYNPKKGIAERVPLTVFPSGQRSLDLLWKSITSPYGWEKLEEGGVIKAQGGSALEAVMKENREKWEAQNAAKESKRIAQESLQKQYKEAERKANVPSSGNPEVDANNARNIGAPIKSGKLNNEWEWDDYTRLGAVGSDLVGLIAGFVPGGSVVSTGSGFLSTGANLIADLKDGFQWSDAGNAAVGLGMDILSIIPGLGIAAKGSKVAKNVIKWAPRLLTAWGAMSNTGPAIESLNKLRTKGWNELNVQDWKNIANGIHLIVSGGRGAKRQVQAKSLLNKAKTDMVNVKTSGKPAKLTTTQLAELKQRNGLKEQNEYLKTLVGDQKGVGILETKFGGSKWNPTRNFNNPNVVPIYDFKTKITKPIVNSKGKIVEKDVPLFYTPLEQMIARNAQRSLPTFELPNLNIGARYNTYKYRNLKKKPSKKQDGGVLIRRMQGGAVMNRNTSPLGNKYLRSRNTFADATNPNTWNDYYDRSAIIADNANIFSNIASNDIVSTLNDLTTQSLSWKPTLNGRGYTNWNNNFQNIFGNLNDTVFGKDIDKFDYMGPTTWNRGALLRDMAKKYNSPENALKTRDGSIYNKEGKWVSTGTNMLPEVTVTAPKLNQSTETANTSTKTDIKAIPGKNRKGFEFLPEDAIATGRMIGTVMANNRATRKIKGALRPTLFNTFENYVPQTEDYLGKTSSYNQAANIERQARRIAKGTSDGNLAASALLEGTSKGNQARLQGDALNSQRLFQTGMLGLQESNAAKARRVEVANKNKMAMNATDLAKAQLDAQNGINNWMQAIQPWAAGIESRIRNNRAMRKQMDLEGDNLESYNYLGQLQNKLAQDVQSGATTEEEASAVMQRAQMDSYRQSLERRKNLARGSYLFAPSYAKGGSLSGKDRAIIQRAKDFNKSVSQSKKEFMKELQHIRRTHSDLMKGLSSFTADLIKAGMLWK